MAQREAAGNPKLQIASLQLVPLFQSCSYYFPSSERDSLSIEFRRPGETWRPAYPPVYVAEDQMYRGSLVNLAEDTAYEFRVVEGKGSPLAQGQFRTWSSEVPVAKTIVLDETNFDGHLRITESGTSTGWIRYTTKEGFVLRNDRSGPLLELSRLKYVLLDGMTLRGGLKQVITIQRCEHVRVRNCDIAGWGRLGKQRFDLNGMYYTPDGEEINWDTAILISRSFGTVVERCYVHDPVNTANSWYYAHPAGPQAVGIDKPQSTVLRHNDFVGSDEHRWNDGVEGSGNFDIDGGFRRDADIHGNFICFANDDAVEIDGGQTNVRVYHNWFEGCLCGPSIQGCMSGPSYVFENLLVNMGDERGLAVQSIKTSSNLSGRSAVSFIFGNTTFGPANDLRIPSHLRIVARNNLFAGKRNITDLKDSPRSDCDFNFQTHPRDGAGPHGLTGDPKLRDPARGLYDLEEGSPAIGRGTSLANFTDGRSSAVDLGAYPQGGERVLPLRPIPVRLDRNQLQFTREETAAATSKKVVASVTEEGFVGRYRIGQNEAFDWFTVAPTSGTLTSGSSQAFTVTLQPERMEERELYRGAFLIRLTDGTSRPVMIYASTDYQQAVKPERKGVWTQYLEAEKPLHGSAFEVIQDASASGGAAINLSNDQGKEPARYRFEVPQSGTCYILVRTRAAEPTDDHDSIRIGVDGGELASCQLRAGPEWRWCLAAQNSAMTLSCLQAFSFDAGEHVLELAPREEVLIDLVALTSDPAPFE